MHLTGKVCVIERPPTSTAINDADPLNADVNGDQRC
jgi:hypothetical protein